MTPDCFGGENGSEFMNERDADSIDDCREVNISTLTLFVIHVRVYDANRWNEHEIVRVEKSTIPFNSDSAVCVVLLIDENFRTWFSPLFFQFALSITLTRALRYFPVIIEFIARRKASFPHFLIISSNPRLRSEILSWLFYFLAFKIRDKR